MLNYTPPTAAEFFQHQTHVTESDALYLYETLLLRKEQGENIPQSLLNDLYRLIQTVDVLHYY